MNQISQPIVFFGTEDFSGHSLEALIEAGFPVALVITKPDTPKGRGHKITPPAVKVLAEKNGIAVLQPSNITEIIPHVQSLENPLGVLVSFGKIIPQSILDLFNPGIINLHPSLLPKYRGPSPIESAILHGDSETGVSIMLLDKAMDAGPIYHQIDTALNGTETKTDLYLSLGELGARELVKVLPLISRGDLQPTPQDDSKVSYCALLSKDQGIINPAKMSAQQAERQVRAYQNFPKSSLNIAGQQCIVLEAKFSEIKEKDQLSIEFSDGLFLIIISLISQNGKKMSGSDFLRGYA